MATSGLFEDLNRAGYLSVGLKPQWVDHPNEDGDYSALPSSGNSGVYLQGSPRVGAQVALRENVAYRTCRAKVGTAVFTGTTYTIVVGGNSVGYNTTSETPADADELVQGIVDSLNADGAVAAIGTALVDPDDEDGLTIVFHGDVVAGGVDFAWDTSVTGGSGTWDTASADPISCDLRYLTTPGGIVAENSVGNPDGWTMPPGGFFEALDRWGFIERLNCAGCGRGYLLVDNVEGHADDGAEVTCVPAAVMLGPVVLEATGGSA